MLVDTHCHIHEAAYPLDPLAVLERARAAGVDKLICVGTNEQSSREAIAFATSHDGVFASVGVHPHDARDGWEEIGALLLASAAPLAVTHSDTDAELATAADVFMNKGAQVKSTSAMQMSSFSTGDILNNLQPEYDRASGPLVVPGAKPVENGIGEGAIWGAGKNSKYISDKLVAIGEIGLDYFYTHSPRAVQIEALEQQIDVALRHNLPVIFHVRDAFEDFWAILDNFHGLRGELHSFTDSQANMEEGLKRGLYIGVNGISTFTKDEKQRAMFASIPTAKLLLETDAPFLTPVPFRGKVNEPAFVRNVAEYHAKIRGLSLEDIATITTANATALFAWS